MSLVIKNAVIVNADSASSKLQEILIEKGVIVKIAASIKKDGAKSIDAKGSLVLPGFVDLHVHFREPGREDKETIETGSRAAVKGGFTTVMCMPNTKPVIDNCMIVESIIKEANRVGLVTVIPVGAVTKGIRGEELSDIVELGRAGCRALSDDGNVVATAQLMRRALEYVRMNGMLIIEHCEDPSLMGQGVMNEGYNSTVLGLNGIPGVSETSIIARDIEIARYLGARIHFAHVSLKRSVEIIRQAKADGVAITAEVCPHHFSLTDEAVIGYDTNTKVNPPLRSAEDVAALKAGLADGTIDCIVTDHAPHTTEDKEVDYNVAPFGITGLETALGLSVAELIEPKVLSWQQFVDKISFAPARMTGLDNKGCIKEGADADITIVDPNEEWVVDKKDFVSKGKNSPFIGRKLKGRVKITINNGKIVYNER